MPDTNKNIAIVLELERSVKYLKYGLSEIQKITAANDFYDPTFLFLSNGLERLFKIMLCLNFKEINKRFPTTNELWNNKNGHDIILLKKKIEKLCIPTDSKSIMADFKIITQDKLINKICYILSEFGKKGRYFYLDAVLDSKQGFDSYQAWEELETKLCLNYLGKDKFYEMMKKPTNIDDIYIIVCFQLMIKIEELIRALSRQFLFGNFSSESKLYYSIIKDFAQIEDDQLGKTAYVF